MDMITDFVGKLNGIVWGPPMLFLLAVTGAFLMAGLLAMPLRKVFYAFKLLFTPPRAGEGDISPFKALMTALSATVGTGNIAGVAITISLGGPGAMFWLIIAGLIGMTTKFVECTLGVQYRDVGEDGTVYGGPMYYISKGLKNKGFADTRFAFKRDLGSFRLSFDWTPFGRYERWYFFIGIKSSLLSDIKWENRSQR